MALTSVTRNFVLNYNFAFHSTVIWPEWPETNVPVIHRQDGESREVCRIWESIWCFIAPKVLKIKSFYVINVTLWHSSPCDSRGDYWIILSWNLKTFWFKAPCLQRCPEARRHSDPVKALRMLQCFYSHLLHVLIFPEVSLGCFLHFIGLNLRTLSFSEESGNREWVCLCSFQYILDIPKYIYRPYIKNWHF